MVGSIVVVGVLTCCTLLHMKVTVIAMVTGVLGTVSNRLGNGLQESEIRGRIETMQVTTLF